MKNNLSPIDQIPPKPEVLPCLESQTSPVLDRDYQKPKTALTLLPLLHSLMELPVLNRHEELSVVVYNDLLFFGLPELEE